ncbi:hypothetical protein RRG08_067116 [Elysia crispata]|uniref:Uncharacterized protein n=1 Tax=Elysia crispata TaxID=231223 RepID=A0AAE1DFV7_9GAST|nr:hypothetical protein RRG08_067116 [Elysia crispata]
MSRRNLIFCVRELLWSELPSARGSFGSGDLEIPQVVSDCVQRHKAQHIYVVLCALNGRVTGDDTVTNNGLPNSLKAAGSPVQHCGVSRRCSTLSSTQDFLYVGLVQHISVCKNDNAW